MGAKRWPPSRARRGHALAMPPWGWCCHRGELGDPGLSVCPRGSPRAARQPELPCQCWLWWLCGDPTQNPRVQGPVHQLWDLRQWCHVPEAVLCLEPGGDQSPLTLFSGENEKQVQSILPTEMPSDSTWCPHGGFHYAL